MTEWKCESCKKDLLLSVGPAKATALIMMDYPDESNVKKNAILATRGGSAIRREFAYAGIDITRIRVSSFWLHPPNSNASCYNYMVLRALQEIKNKGLIMLMGSAPVKALIDKPIAEISGLDITSPILQTVKHIVACPSPGTLFKGNIGELRFAIKTFAKILKEITNG